MWTTSYISPSEWICMKGVAGMVVSLFCVAAIALLLWAILVRSGRVTSASVLVVFYTSAVNMAFLVAFLLSTPGSFLSKDPMVWLIVTPFAVCSVAALIASTALAATGGLFRDEDRPRAGALAVICTLIVYYTFLVAFYPASLAFWSVFS